MAAFSSSSSLFQQQQQHHHHQSFLIDSVFLPNSPTTIKNYNNKLCSLFEEPNNTYSCFPQFFQPADESPPRHNLDQINCNNNDDEANSVVSVTIKNSTTMDSSYNSIVTDKCDHHSTDQVMTTITDPDPPMEKKNKRKSKEGSSPNSAQSKDKREVKEKKQKKMKDYKQEKKATEEAPTGYIHVRARRGQATDSHSLAERVRREKISERMKLLQALVPGCDKVTGKALMLDEIINYVQSLQNQVEFLSMKLASVNPMSYDFGVDLESFMVRPDQDLSDLPSPMLPNMQECNPTTTTDDHYHLLLENSANSIMFQQSQIPNNVLPQGSNIRQSLWEVDEHRQKIINQSGFSSNLFSFH